VAELHATVFGQPVGASPGSRQRYIADVFLDHPWRDLRIPSLVYEEDDRSISGFLGVVPRRLSLGGRSLLGAVCSQFVVHPDKRGMVGLQLLKAVFEGPQDFTITDEANDATRKIWEGRGGATALLYSFTWIRPLRAGELVASWLRRRPGLAPLAGIARPVVSAAAGIAGRVLRRPLQPSLPDAGGEDLTDESLASCVAAHGDVQSLRPHYDARSAGWLLNRALSKRGGDRLNRTRVIGETGETLGWYIYSFTRRGIAEVLQLGATRQTIAQVLNHLFYTASRDEATAVTGRLEPVFMDELLRGLAVSLARGPWMLVHSRDSALVHAIQRGDTLLSRLDGEWCLRYRG
jgi:hypothetical protein